MIILLLERHADPTGSINILLNKIKLDRKLDHNNCISYERSLEWNHPEEQINQLKNIVKRYNYPAHAMGNTALHATLFTYSLLPIYYFNNQLVKDPNFHIEAYEVIPPSVKKPAHLKSAMKGNWIDESIVSHVFDGLHNEYLKLTAKRKKK